MRSIILFTILILSESSLAFQAQQEEGKFILYNSETFVIQKKDGRKIRYKFKETDLINDGDLASLLEKKITFSVRNKH
jgi:ribonuclease HIII